MISFLSNLLTTILGFLGDFLPDDPFESFIQANDSLQLALGWLNWFVPVGDFLLVFGAWVAALGVWIAVRLAMGKVIGIADKLV